MAQRSLKTVGGGTRVAVGRTAGGGGSLVLGEPAGHDADRLGEAVPAHGLAVAAAAFGGAGRASAVDVGDAAVAQGDQVVDGEAQAGGVVGAHDVDGAVATGRATTTTGNSGGEVGELASAVWGPSRISASQRSCEQARDRAALVAAGVTRAEHELVAGRVRGAVEAARRGRHGRRAARRTPRRAAGCGCCAAAARGCRAGSRARRRPAAPARGSAALAPGTSRMTMETSATDTPARAATSSRVGAVAVGPTLRQSRATRIRLERSRRNLTVDERAITAVST